MITRFVFALLIAAGVTGCATTFTGDAHVSDGRAGCEAKCRGQGMALAGMVFMGEYTSGCVCTVAGQTASAEHDMMAAAGAGAGAGSAGVVMQMRAQAEQQRHASMH